MRAPVDRNRRHVGEVAEQQDAVRIEQREIVDAANVARLSRRERVAQTLLRRIGAALRFLGQNDAYAAYVAARHLEIDERKSCDGGHRNRQGEGERQTEGACAEDVNSRRQA